MQRSDDSAAKKTVIGWREWVTLPGLGVEYIKAKIDTGARTSALHTSALEVDREHGQRIVRFGVHPLQHDSNTSVRCRAAVVDERRVRDSGGHREWRFVIVTPIRIGDRQWDIELTLTARDTMIFRMLVGRTAMRSLRVDPLASFMTGRPPENKPPRQ